MSEIRAEFEPGIWKDFSKEHAALRKHTEDCLDRYRQGKFTDPIAVWGAFGAGKTQFLYWVAEKALDFGLIPVYFHLNDLLDGLSDHPSPDAFRDHAGALVARLIDAFRGKPDDGLLLRVYRDRHLVEYISTRTQEVPLGQGLHPVLLVDEVEQAYKSLREAIRADDRSPLRAWLEEPSFKVCAFAVGSLYVLGRADRERLRVWAIPAVRPLNAKLLLSNLPEPAVNALWWLSRGKPRHLMKAAHRYQALAPQGPIEVREYLKGLDSVSQAPYEAESQNVVPAVYADHLDETELGGLLSIGPQQGHGDGKLFLLKDNVEHELIAIVREVFKLEDVVYDLVRYMMMLLEAVSLDGHFALSEADTPYLLRLAVDFLLEYERERVEKDTVEGSAALRKLLEVHDSARKHASEVFWKLQGRVNATTPARCSLSFENMVGAFPLPTTSPTLFDTKPTDVRAKFDDSKIPVFSWREPGGNTVVFLTSLGALLAYSETSEFRQRALGLKSGIVALLPNDADEWTPRGFSEWLHQHNRLRVVNLPLALTDFLLSLRDYNRDGADPFTIAEQAESKQNLQRQVAFYRSRLKAYLDDIACRAQSIVPNEMPRRFSEMLTRVGDKEVLVCAAQQAFEALSPRILRSLVDLRDLVLQTKSLWGQGGHQSVANDLLPHRSPRTERAEAAKIIEDVRLCFSSSLDSLHRLATFVGQDDIESLTDDSACKIALRSLWQTRRGGETGFIDELSGYRAQLLDIVSTLRTAQQTETTLRERELLVDCGALGVLIEGLPQLEKVARHVDDLLGSAVQADARLAIALFAEFLGTLIAAVESDTSKAKATLSRIRDLLDRTDAAEARIKAASCCEPSQFVEVSSEDLESLLDDVTKAANDKLGHNPSLDEIAEELESVASDFENVEELLSRLDEAHRQVKALVAEQTEWT